MNQKRRTKNQDRGFPVLFAQKNVHAAQKNVQPNLHIFLNHNDISKLVYGMLVAF